MQVNIKNYRGIASAELDISKICLVAGPNEAGKTSTAQALAAALTGDPVPIIGVKKSAAGMLVRSGTASGSIDLATDNGSTNIIWPSAKVKTEGQAPYSSHFACGLMSIATMEDKDRVKTLTDYLKATPTREDLGVQLASMNLPATTLDQLWQLIETQGWDNAHLQIKEKGARLKGQWENVTADRYGSKKGESWIPDGYEQDLMGASEDTLKAQVTDARDAMEATIAAEAVDDTRRAELEVLAGLLTERQEAVKAAFAVMIDDTKLNKIKEQVNSGREIVKGGKQYLEEMQAKANPFVASKPPDRMPCPTCKTMLYQTGGVLKVVTENPAALEDQRKAVEEAKQAAEGAEISMKKHQEVLAELERQCRAEQDAYDVQNTARIKNLSEAERLLKESEIAAKEIAVPVPVHVGLPLDACRTTLARAEARLAAYQAKSNADRLHIAISQNAELIAKIAPEGIRGDVLSRALKGFNGKMAPLCKAASWRPVALESDFSVTYGGTPYLLLSESAKFRARTILLLAMALMDKSQAVIVDAADILDKGGRNGLFKAVHSAGLPAMVCMTIDAKELVPNLAKAGLGASYWLDGAVAVAV